MDLKDCIEFANANPVCFLATEDGDQPRVRTVLMGFADEGGLYFYLLSFKRMTEQVKANPKVEVCYYNNPPSLGEAKHMRVTGVAERVNDPAVIKKAASDRAFLDPLAGQPLEPFIEVWRISHGEAQFWTLPDVGTQVRGEPLEGVTF